MLSLKLKIISNSVSIPQVKQDRTPLWQEGAIAVAVLFPQRFGENWNSPGTNTKFLCKVYD